MSEKLPLANPGKPVCPFRCGVGITCCLLALFFLLPAGIETAANPNRPVRLDVPSEHEEELSELTEKVYRNIDYFFGPSPDRRVPPLYIYMRPTTESDRNREAANPFRLILQPTQARRQQAFAIAQRAIFQRAGSLSAEQSSVRFITPDTTWLAAAVTYAALQATPEQKINPRPDYKSLDSLFQKGHFPDLKTLVISPVTPEHPLFFRMYSMHCHLLLNLIRGPVSGGWRSTSPPTPPSALLLDLARDGIPPAIALRQTFEQVEETSESLQEWYQMKAPALARRGLRHLTSDRVVEELFLILTIDPEAEKLSSVTGPLESENGEEMFQEKEADRGNEGDSSSRRQSLLKSDDQEFWRTHRRFAAERYRRLLWMYPRTPMLLKDSVNKYMQAMFIIARNGPTQRFVELVQEGDRLMKQNLPRQRQFEEVIRRAKQEHPGFRISLEHRLMIPFIDKESRKREMVPDLNEFLNRYSVE